MQYVADDRCWMVCQRYSAESKTLMLGEKVSMLLGEKVSMCAAISPHLYVLSNKHTSIVPTVSLPLLQLHSDFRDFSQSLSCHEAYYSGK